MERQRVAISTWRAERSNKHLDELADTLKEMFLHEDEEPVE
jgi:hypothetical protein